MKCSASSLHSVHSALKCSSTLHALSAKCFRGHSGPLHSVHRMARGSRGGPRYPAVARGIPRWPAVSRGSPISHYYFSAPGLEVKRLKSNANAGWPSPACSPQDHALQRRMGHRPSYGSCPEQFLPKLVGTQNVPRRRVSGTRNARMVLLCHPRRPAFFQHSQPPKRRGNPRQK